MTAEQIKETYSNFIYLRTYSRWLEKQNRRETWDETVDRYATYMKKRVPACLSDEYKEAIEAIRNKEIMPSMRLLWVAGKACDVDNVSAYNCAYTPIDKIDRFHEILYILMNGVGVGYSVERQEINKLPNTSTIIHEADKRTITVEDSKEGWALALKELLTDWYMGIPSDWDVSLVRPEGTPLKTFGGRASGSRPLVDLFLFTKNTIFNAKGRKLNSQEVSDIVCKIAQVVIVGGVRRSACICFSNLSDPRMRRYKEGEYWNHSPQRAYANISVAYTEKPDMASFMEEWISLMMSGTGERGIVNVEAYPDKDMRMNPCQPANANILTPKGISTIGQLEIGDTIWSEDGWVQVINKQSSGVQKVYKYATTSGYFLGTKEHKIVSNGEKVEVCEAETIDTLQGEYKKTNKSYPTLIMDGLVLGDGSVHKASNNRIYLEIGQHDKDYFISEVGYLIEGSCGVSDYSHIVKTDITPEELPYTYERAIPHRYKCMSYSETCSFLRGLYTANGSVVRQRITYKTASRQMVDDIQLLLSSVGISSYFTTNKPKDVAFSNGVYTCKESYDINISTHSERFMQNIGFVQEYKNEKGWAIARDTDKGKKTYDIKDAVYIGEEEVFDLTVDGTHHTYWTGGMNVSNCGERVLQPQQLCNLTEVVVTQNITPEELRRRVKLATLLGTLQASLTKFNHKVLSKEWVNNTKQDAMLGVSLTGTSNKNWKATELEDLRHYAKRSNEFYAEKIGINPAYGITNNKPSGCQSPDTLIPTNEGILRLDEIGDVNGETWQDINKTILQENHEETTSKFFINGVANVKTLHMSSGLTLTSTFNHKYRVLRNGEYTWCVSEDINVGDIIPYRVGGYNGGSYQKLKNIEAPYCNVRQIKQPTTLCEDFAYFLGLYIADGSTHNKGIRIAGNVDDQAPLLKAKKIIHDLFGIEGIIYERTSGNNADLYINSTYFLAFMRENGLLKQKTEEIDVLACIRYSPKSVIASYLSGYVDGDGHISKAQGTTIICTVSEKMAKSVCVLYRALGEACSVKEMPPTNTSWGSKMRYRITVLRGRKGHYHKTNEAKYYKQLDALGLFTLVPDKVENVTYGTANTYDIEVPKNNTFIANSYVSHNTVSQLVGCSSGIHPDYSEYYIRRVRVAKTDPLCSLLIDQGIPHAPEVGTAYETTDTFVFAFPIQGSAFRVKASESAIDQLEYYKLFKQHWCDERGNPSCTIYVKEDEWLAVGAWVYHNWDCVGGLSFLNADGGVYQLAPYEEITEEKYKELCASFPNVDFSKLPDYEKLDTTEGAKEYSCSAGGCELR